MKKVRPSKQRKQVTEHWCMKPKIQLPSLKAQCLLRNTTEFVKSTCLSSWREVQTLRWGEAIHRLKRKKRAERKHQESITGCRKTAKFLTRKKRNATSNHLEECREHWWYKTERCRWHTRRLCFHSTTPRQTRELGREEANVVQQGQV